MQSMKIVSIIVATSMLYCANARAINENSNLARINEGLYAIKTVLVRQSAHLLPYIYYSCFRN